MDGVFKSLQPKDVKITPFQAFREVTADFKTTDFKYYNTEYDLDSSYPFPYPGHTSIDIGEPVEEARFTETGPVNYKYFATVMHQQLDALYYRHYLSHNHSTADTTNINYQYRDLGYAASVISCARRQIGEGIMPMSVRLRDQGIDMVDDGYGNLILSGTLEPAYGHIAYSTTFNRYYKFIDELPGNQYQPLSYGGCRLQAFMSNVTFAKDGTSAVALKLDDSRVELRALENPYVKKILNFTNRDFAIAFKATGTGLLLTKQSATDEWATGPGGTIVSSSVVPQQFPYRIQLAGGAPTFTKKGGSLSATLSGGAGNVVIQRSGSQLQIFTNGAAGATANDPCMTGGCYGSDILCANNSDILIGCEEDGSSPLDGTLTYLHIFNRALTPDEIQALHDNNGSINGHCGNVFYNTGIIAITRGDSIGSNGPDSLTFNSTVTLLETQVFCTVGPGDFTRTLNPSTHTWNPVTNQLETACRYTGSEFRPYVTTVGLYDDYNNLIAIGKLSTPVQTSRTTDTTFVIKFDR